MVSEGLATSGVVTIWVSCTATWGHVAAMSYVWGHRPAVVRVWVDAHVSCCHQGLSRCPRSRQLFDTILVSKGNQNHTHLGGLCYCQGHGDVQAHAATKGIYGFVFLLQLRSVMMFMVHVTMGVIGTMCVNIQWLFWAGSVPYWPQDSWSYPLLNTGARELALPSPSTRSWPLHSGELATMAWA